MLILRLNEKKKMFYKYLLITIKYNNICIKYKNIRKYYSPHKG